MIVSLDLLKELEGKLSKFPEFQEIDLVEATDEKVLLTIKMRTYNTKLLTKISEAISDFIWKKFEETGKMPPLEWTFETGKDGEPL